MVVLKTLLKLKSVYINNSNFKGLIFDKSIRQFLKNGIYLLIIKTF